MLVSSPRSATVVMAVVMGEQASFPHRTIAVFSEIGRTDHCVWVCSGQLSQ